MGSSKRSKKALKPNKRSKSARKMHTKIKTSDSSQQLLFDHIKTDHSYAMLKSSGSIGCSLQTNSIHEDHLYCMNTNKSGLESSLAHQDLHSGTSCDLYDQCNSVEENDSMHYGLTLLDEPTSGIQCEIVEHEVFDGKENICSNTSVDLDSAWGTQEEFESVLNHKLCVEVQEKANPIHSTGNRIVNLQHMLNWALPLQVAHSRMCTCGQLFLWKEEREGFVSHLFFKCTVCNRIIKKSTHQNVLLHNVPKLCEQEYSVNIGAVWGTLSTGNCHSHLEELCCVMDIPPMTYKKFHKVEENLGSCWHDKMVEEFLKAGRDEAEIAKNAGHVDPDGIPFITVYVDGGWSKRSYGHSYTALSGAAIIIGKATKKALFMGVRNKFCYVCALAHNKKEQPKEHNCFKNWNSSSSAMEADIIVEGFNRSIELYQVRYKYFIADGDSSTFAKIRTNVTCGSAVMKIECKNHIFKNYGKHLRNVKADKRIVCKKKYLREADMKQLVDLAKKQLHHNNIHGTVDTVKTDLENGPYHIFGKHSDCKSYYCIEEARDENTTNSVDEMKMCGIFQRIEGLIFDNETNNRAELFMSLLSKFNAGKRLNLTMKGSFEARCTIASLQYNEGPDWHLTAWRSALKKSPNKNLKVLVKRKNRILQYKRNNPKCRRSILSESKNRKKDNDYGIHSLEVELDKSELSKEKERILMKMQVTPEEKVKIERNTVGQFGNFAYVQERQNRLTASFFGRIIKRRPHTPCHNDVKCILYNSNFCNSATEYGKINEKVAIMKFSEKFNITVEESGLFVDLQHGYLGASADGDDGLIEVKCLYNVHKSGLSLTEAAQRKKICLELMDGHLRLKRTDSYYYQVQGQLNITKRDYCYFVVYVNENTDLFVEKIKKDVQLWNNKMLPKLQTFYLENVLPEIIGRNIPKGLKCKDSPRIKNAIKTQQAILQN